MCNSYCWSGNRCSIGQPCRSHRPHGLCLLFIHPPAHGSEVSPAARNTLDSARIPRASKLLICGLFLKGRVLAQDGVADGGVWSHPVSAINSLPFGGDPGPGAVRAVSAARCSPTYAGEPSVDTSNPKRTGARVLSSFVFLDTTAARLPLTRRRLGCQCSPGLRLRHCPA